MPSDPGLGAERLHPALSCHCHGMQSTFMKLVEAEMLMAAARQQLLLLEPGGDREPKGPLHKLYEQLLGAAGLKELKADDWKRLQALASPRLLTVWLNSWWVPPLNVYCCGVVMVCMRMLHNTVCVCRGGWTRQAVCAACPPVSSIGLHSVFASS